MSSISGKTVFITGASAGIGEACARAFAPLGTRLLLCARRVSRLKELAQELEPSAAAIHTFELDVTDADAVDSQLTALPEEWQEIDVLINNAGKAKGLDPIQTGRLEHWEEMIDTNVKGLLYVTRTVVPQMIERKTGHIINIGSTAGHWIYSGGTVYCATKFAVGALTDGFKLDLHGTGIRVSSVDPGLTETEFSVVRFDGDEDRARQVYTDTKALTAEDIADAVLYCATRPLHVNVSRVLVMPTVQSPNTIIDRDDNPSH